MAAVISGTENLSGLHRSNLYRQWLKEADPVKYRHYLEKQKKRVKEKRDKIKRELKKTNPDPEVVKEKERILSLQRKRQEKYENRRKQSGTYLKKSRKEKNACIIETRAKILQRKEYNRQAKRNERERMNYQKKEWVKKKDRERKRRSRERKNISKATVTEVQDKSSTPFRTKKSEWNITSNVRKTLPKSPKKFATILRNVIKNSSPQQKKEVRKTIADEFIHVPEAGLKEMKKTTKGKKALVVLARSLVVRYRNLSKRAVATKLKIDRKNLTKKTKKKKRKSQDVNNCIKEFYKRSDVSRVLPTKRYATKEGPGYLMQISISEAHAKFNLESSVKVGLGRFAAKRPRNVRKLAEKFREYCCCVYCMNVRNKLLTLNRCCPKSKKVSSEGSLLNILLCRKSDNEKFFKQKCVNRECSACNNFAETLKNYYMDIPEEKTFTWVRWEYHSQEGQKKRILKTKSGQKRVILEEFIQDILQPSQGTTFVSHLHTAKWQDFQFSLIKNTLPEQTLLQVVDFAKNRSIKYQEEIKSVFYTVEQITMYPVVSYYHTQQGVVREADIVISDDLNHDYHAVDYFQEKVYMDLSNRIGIPDKTILFSDGCSAQFKSRGPFGILAKMDRKVNRNFFGSEHGKGDCDAEIGVVNRALDRAITGKKVVINNVLDMYMYCHENLEIDDCLSKRRFFYIPKSEIQRQGKENHTKTVKGTRKLHQIINNSPELSTLLVRNLSCFCESCQMDSQGYSCVNKEFVAPFKKIYLTSNSGEPGSSKNITESACDEGKRQPSQKQSANKENNSSKNAAKSTKEKKPSPKKKTRKRTRKALQLVNVTPEQLSIEGDERVLFFRNTLSSLQKSSSFDELQRRCLHLTEDKYFRRCHVQVDDTVTVVQSKLVADKVALRLLPVNNDLSNRLPVRITGDGNCLPKMVSVACFGNEEHHEEIRVRIVTAMCLGEELYTNNDNLQQGLEFPKGEGDHLSVTYTMMSQLYTAGDKITPSVIKRIFRAEAMAVVRDKEYMGIWQLFALADMLGSTVFSVYPDLGGPVPKAVLGREINPLVLRHRKPLFIMWTSTREDLQKENWIPNHFVPLIQVCGRNENFTDDSDENIELDDSLLDTLLQTVTDSQEMESPIPVIACSQELESPIPVIASSQEMESSIPVIASSQEMESPIPVIASSQEMESPIIAYQGNHHSRSLESPITAISQAMESPIASSQEMESLIASSQEMESLMASSQEMEILMASSQAMESPIASSQETESPIKAYQGNQHVQSPAIIDDENLASVGEQNQATMDNSYSTGQFLLIAHGKKSYPAVVQEWPFVSFFEKKRGGWVMGSLKHAIITADILSKLDPPQIEMYGSRMLYKFGKTHCIIRM